MISTDPDRRIGFTNDPAETTALCFWAKVGKFCLYVYPWRIKLVHD